MAIYNHWGYQSGSGPARIIFAALKYYGLLRSIGSGEHRKGQLTDLALDILLDEREDSLDRENAIKKAALLPLIHAEIWQENNGNLPSDQSLRYTLRREKGFTDRGVNEFLEQFRNTLTYAKLTSLNDMPEDLGGISNEETESNLEAQDTIQRSQRRQPHQPSSIGRDVQLPLSKNSWATLKADFPITEASWDQMIAVLQAMKPGLVVDDKPEDEEEGGTHSL